MAVKTRIFFPMNKFFLILTASLLLWGCSNSTWILQDDVVLDKSEGELLSSSQFVQIEELPTTDRPVIRLHLYDRNEYSYPVRQNTKRYVQQYRPRYSYMLLGLGGAALAFYLANSPDFDDDVLSRNEKIALNGAGGIIALAALLNMKPVGEPLDTGEKKLLKKVGETAVTDTLRVTGPGTAEVHISAWHNDDLIKSGMTGTFRNGSLSFNLVDRLQIEGFKGEHAGDIHLEVEHENNLYTFSVPVNSFMDKFVSVTNENVPLRSNASELTSNIITNIGRDSRFPFVELVDNHWYRILFGISPVFISMNDAGIIWLPGNIDADDLILSPGESVFGDIDIERNIPETEQINADGFAVLIANGAFEEPLRGFDETTRSLELMKSYIIRTLGYPPDNIIVMENAREKDFMDFISGTDSTRFMNRTIRPDTTDILVYYMGHAVADRRDETEAYLLPVDYNPANPSERLVKAKEFFSAIGKVQTRSTTVLMETDFILRNIADQQFSQNVRGGVLLRELAAYVTSNHPNTAVIFAANRSQQAGQFASSDGRINNRYGIFTYYFCQALKDGRASAGDIFGSLQRNMTFTSRRLHDRAQDPQFFGNPAMRLIPEAD